MYKLSVPAVLFVFGLYEFMSASQCEEASQRYRAAIARRCLEASAAVNVLVGAARHSEAQALAARVSSTHFMVAVGGRGWERGEK